MSINYLKKITVLLFGLILIGSFASGNLYADENEPDNDPTRVLVADPFMELRTGPGRGFPVFYVEERGKWVRLLKRKTSWYKVELENGQVGWVDMDQISKTLLAVGLERTLSDSVADDFFNRKNEVGFVWGSHAGFSFIGISAARKLGDKFSLKVEYAEVAEVFSTSKLFNLNLVSHPFAEWTFSPYFELGVGKKIVTPIRSQVGQERTDTITANVGFGLRAYVTKNFVARIYYRRYAWFFDDFDTHPIDEFAFGAAFFF